MGDFFIMESGTTILMNSVIVGVGILSFLAVIFCEYKCWHWSPEQCQRRKRKMRKAALEALSPEQFANLAGELELPGRCNGKRNGN